MGMCCAILKILVFYKWLLIWNAWISQAAPPPNWDIRATIHPPLAAVEYLQSSDDTDIPAALTYQDNKTPDTGTTAKDCLESLRTCETQRGICRVDLEIFKQFCGDWRNERSLIGCHRQFVKECRSALKTVNHGRPNLRHCTCDGQVSRSIEDLSKCNLLRRNLNSHPCIQEPPLLYREITNFNLNVEHRLKDSAEKRDSATPIEQTSTQESSELFSGANAAPQITTNSSHPGAGSSDEKAELPFVGYSEQITTQEPSKLTADNQPVSQGMEQRLENVNLTFSSVANTTSCLVLLEQCTNQPSCARTLNRYRALCTPRSCNKLRSQCLLAHRAIERYGTHGNCSCDTEDDQVRKRRCLDYEESVILNQCVALATEETADSKSTHDFSSVELPKLIETQVESQQQGISLHNQQYFKAVATSPGWLTSSSNPEGATTNVSNCYDAYRLCIRNRKCLQVYLQLAITCSNAGTYLLSPTSTCSNRLKEFYSQATAYVHRALSCTCSESDHDCQTQLMIFRPQRIGLDQTNYEDSCSALWNNCQENRNCRANIKYLLLDCARNGAACSLYPEKCIEAYRWWRSMDPLSNCRCMETELFRLTSSEGSHSFTCDTLKQSVIKPPCVMKNYLLEAQRTLHSNPHSVACFVTARLELSPTTAIRVLANETQTNLVTKSSECSYLCSCSGGCQHRLCALEQRRFENDRRFKEVSPEGSRRDVTVDEKITRGNSPFPCQYASLIDSSCTCRVNGDVWCDVFQNIGPNILLDFQFVLRYDRRELVSVVQLLTENLVNSELQYFNGLISIGRLLVGILRNSTGDQDCGLVLNEHRIEADAFHDSSTPRLFGGADAPDSADRGKTGYLVYAITTRPSLLIHWQSPHPNRDSDQDARSQCVESVKLLKLMVNRRYGEIRFPAVLSVLKRAEIVFRSKSTGTTSAYDRSAASSLDSVGDDRHVNQATWRQPRTSVAKPSGLSHRLNGGNTPSFRSCTLSPIMTVITSFAMWCSRMAL
ncbi:hypothetical protein CSKR_104306 [Clonorchis sinensis]|uniref:GDNF family receptor alpha-1 n=1 Tax=Clonorchis sinensis TaxID=79923 RepID=A0A3R7JTB1_CLOSI|nr:hypothetical protein CSKR_104306 [Clonorchis sinensis]